MSDNFSALGYLPICDICKQPIKDGDYVMQVFIGRVSPIEPALDTELGVQEEKYQLFHVECEKRKVN